MMTKNSTYYTKHTILTSPHHITYTNDNGTKKHSYNLSKITPVYKGVLGVILNRLYIYV